MNTTGRRYPRDRVRVRKEQHICRDAGAKALELYKYYYINNNCVKPRTARLNLRGREALVQNHPRPKATPRVPAENLPSVGNLFFCSRDWFRTLDILRHLCR